MSEPLLQIEHLTKTYGELQAVDDVSFTLQRGSLTGVVGESGSGKSTLARLILRLEDADSGRIAFDGLDLLSLKGNPLRRARKRFQMIFQDPYASLNPRMKIRDILSEPMRAHGVPAVNRQERIRELMERIQLPVEMLDRHAHMLSGGQRQRIGIARALALKPDFIIADEPTAALDVSIQAEILALLKEMQAEYHFTLLFISHDLAVVHSLCEQVLVMRRGQIVESGDRQQIFHAPAHPYTRELLAACPGTASARQEFLA
jgi:ABC-type glutathione transport system ATPase component